MEYLSSATTFSQECQRLTCASGIEIEVNIQDRLTLIREANQWWACSRGVSPSRTNISEWEASGRHNKGILSYKDTNVVGTKHDLQQKIQRPPQNNKETMCAKDKKWSFNAPVALHHGDMWRSRIKQIRQILYGLIAEIRRP